MKSHSSARPPADRRPQPRKRSLIGALVAYEGGAKYFDCAIKDFSKEGTRITLAKGQPIPSKVYLINLRDRTAHEAIVKWNSGSEAGLKFIASIPLAKITDPALGFLKRLWLERAAR